MTKPQQTADEEQPNDIVHKQARQQEEPAVTPRDLGKPCDEETMKQPNRKVG